MSSDWVTVVVNGAVLELAVRSGADDIHGQRFAAQHEDARWLQQA